MKNTYIKPEMTAVQIDCERGMLAASGEKTTSVASDDDYADTPSYSKDNNGIGNSLWDE